jgi:hypothetical protein
MAKFIGDQYAQLESYGPAWHTEEMDTKVRNMNQSLRALRRPAHLRPDALAVPALSLRTVASSSSSDLPSWCLPIGRAQRLISEHN